MSIPWFGLPDPSDLIPASQQPGYRCCVATRWPDGDCGCRENCDCLCHGCVCIWAEVVPDAS